MVSLAAGCVGHAAETRGAAVGLQVAAVTAVPAFAAEVIGVHTGVPFGSYAYTGSAISGVDLPPGWLGKPWACAQLAAASDAEILVFVDADVRLAAGAVAAAVTAMGDADLASVFPRHDADGAVRLVQPLLTWTWLTTSPLRLAERSARPSSPAR